MKMYKSLICLAITAGMALPGIASAACEDANPLVTVTSEGGGQSSSVNGTLTARFTGHITTTSGLTNRGRNTVKICPGTTVEYEITSSVGNDPRMSIPDCKGNMNFGTLSVGDKISCTNSNLGGSDTDTFTVKAGG